MNAQKSSLRSLILLGVLSLIFLVAINFWACSRMLASQKRFEAASRDLTASQRQVAEIQRLRYRPTVASSLQESISDSEMTQRLDKALAQAGLRDDQLTETPSSENNVSQESKPNENNNYKQQRTDITLIGVSLTQLVQFCEYLEDPQKGLVVRGLNLRPDPSIASTGVELWTVSLTLTQLIFSPTS